jgi:hypothetical protein
MKNPINKPEMIAKAAKLHGKINQDGKVKEKDFIFVFLIA